jgi:hypothetical protein
MKDISIFEKLTSLRKLDISGHPNFLMTEDQIKEEEEEMKAGAPDSDNIDFNPRHHSIDAFLATIPNVRSLKCD